MTPAGSLDDTHKPLCTLQPFSASKELALLCTSRHSLQELFSRLDQLDQLSNSLFLFQLVGVRSQLLSWLMGPVLFVRKIVCWIMLLGLCVWFWAWSTHSHSFSVCSGEDNNIGQPSNSETWKSSKRLWSWPGIDWLMSLGGRKLCSLHFYSVCRHVGSPWIVIPDFFILQIV